MLKKDKLWKKALKFIPSGNNFLSKNPSRFKSRNWPIYFTKSKGCEIWDLENKKYTDFSFMGVGTNILGYSYSKVDKEVIKVVNNGNLTTLNCPEEVQLAEQLVKMHKWSDSVKFARTGAEANTIAVRLSRAFNKKNKIIVCGYHGWHDWYLSAKLSKKNFMDTHLFPNLKVNGVPTSLKGSTYSIKFNDIHSILKILKKDRDISSIIMEVERDKKPNLDYLKSVRKICDKNNICLIFDECTSGFRETYGGIHLKYKIYPDIAMFGKAIGNGYALTAIIGKKKIMNESKNTFISSTFWSERIGYAAALATLKEMKRIQSWKKIKLKGQYIKKSLHKIAQKYDLDIKFFGLDSLIRFEILNLGNFDYAKFINEQMLKKNFLATQNIYVSIAHTKKKIDNYLKYIDYIFKKISHKKNK
jgi:glutamate-1-semialdehyde 2,1-aminomutase